MATLNPNSTSTHSNHIMAYLESRFYAFLRKELHLAPLGMKKTLPLNSGKTCKWNQWTVIPASTTALTEGTSPSGLTMASSNYTATIAAYGQFVTVTDYLQMSAINDTHKDAADLLAYTAALSVDQLVRNELDANGTQNYADSGSNSSKANVESGTDQISSVELKQVLKNFRVGDVPTFEDGLYRGVINPYMEFSLLSESSGATFITLSAYNGSAKDTIEKGEIGTAFGIKLLRSSNIRADVTSTHTYGNIFVGRDAIGTVDLESAGLKIIVHETGSAGSEDPLNQRGTIGYKFYYAVKILETVRTQIVWAYGA